MIEIKGVRFPVEINRKRIRNMYIKLVGETIIVSAPLRMPEYEIYRFINEKRDWISRAYERQNEQKSYSMLYRGGDTFYFFGVPYQLVKHEGRKNVQIDGDVIRLTYKEDSDDSIRYLYKQLDRYLLERAEEYLGMYRPVLIDYGYTLKPELKCRIMSSRWGVCFPRKNRIHISSYLIHYPERCLEYIIIHELTHFIVPNHSQRFYEIVRRLMPDYKEVAAKLKQ